MSEYIFVTNIFEYLNIRIYSSHSALGAIVSFSTFIQMLKLFTSDIIIVISALYLIWLWLSWYCHDGSDVDYDHHSDDDDDDGDKYPFLPSGSLSDLTAGAPTTKGTTQPPSHQTSPSNQTIKTPNHQTIKTSKYQKVKPSKHHHHTACQWHPHSWADQLRVTFALQL